MEASIVLPIFLCTMLFFFQMCRAAEAQLMVYEAVSEAAEYMAEYAYLEKQGGAVPDEIMLYAKFQTYLDDKQLVEQYVKGGAAGILFVGSEMPDDEGMVRIRYSYMLSNTAPFAGQRNQLVTGEVVQKAYLGDGSLKGKVQELGEDPYVYIAENKSVYHLTRDCTYLSLSIQMQGLDLARTAGFTECQLCDGPTLQMVYVTKEGDRYHNSIHCSGLKRTVSRVRLSETGGIPPCSRCGKGR